MDNIEIIYASKGCRFNINQQKILIGNNYRSKHSAIRSLMGYLRKETLSEYSQENGYEQIVNFNGQRMDAKRWMPYIINSWLDVDDEIKLGAKSITMKFLESVLSDIERDDNYQCLMSALSVLSSETISEIGSMFGDETFVNFTLDDFSFKTLIKLISANLIKDGFAAKDYNLDFDEKICLYLSMIREVAKKNYGMNVLIIIDTPEYNHKIKNSIESMPKNCRTIVMTSTLSCSTNFSDIMVIGKKQIDLSNENELFEKICLESSDTIDINHTTNNLREIFAHSFQTMHTDKILNDYL